MAKVEIETLGLQLSLLQSISEAMLGELELDQLFIGTMAGITHPNGLGFNRAFLFLVDQDDREIRFATAYGAIDEPKSQALWASAQDTAFDLRQLVHQLERYLPDVDARGRLAQRMTGFIVPLSATSGPFGTDEQDVPLQALIARCAQQREPFCSNTLTAEYPPQDDSAGEPLHFSHMALVPLVSKKRVLGVILADNSFAQIQISDDQLRVLATIGNLVALAIERHRLQRRLGEMEALDGLTGVYNRRHFEMRMEQEINKARRNRRSLALIVFGIDHFAQFNQQHGHVLGDQVLKDLALLLCEHVRAEDMVVRYGPEEFGVLLTGGATLEETHKVAEKLKTSVSQSSLAGQSEGDLTVSGGIAHQSETSLDGQRLNDEASMALKQAKELGRNRVEVFQ